MITWMSNDELEKFKLSFSRGAVRGFRVKRDRPNLFSVIRNQKKIKFVNRE